MKYSYLNSSNNFFFSCEKILLNSTRNLFFYLTHAPCVALPLGKGGRIAFLDSSVTIRSTLKRSSDCKQCYSNSRRSIGNISTK